MFGRGRNASGKAKFYNIRRRFVEMFDRGHGLAKVFGRGPGNDKVFGRGLGYKPLCLVGQGVWYVPPVAKPTCWVGPGWTMMCGRGGGVTARTTCLVGAAVGKRSLVRTTDRPRGIEVFGGVPATPRCSVEDAAGPRNSIG